MALQNAWIYTRTTFNDNLFKENTNNQFIFVSQRPYANKKDASETGTTLTLQVVIDKGKYGVDKKTNLERDNNVYNTFDVTILNNRQHIEAKKGDTIRLGELIQDKTYVFDFNLILRYKSVQVIPRANK
ncbi:hypothetical protein AKUH3B203J_11810 [Apilactobacillus kunkeei]|nr:hypothetical protein AKUH3B203J_11810 [Apilactobacillus kunkeei]CAI2687320.1 hypothetical protein AKUH4B501J_11280 [Apilactobacillus kunkeei]